MLERMYMCCHYFPAEILASTISTVVFCMSGGRLYVFECVCVCICVKESRCMCKRKSVYVKEKVCLYVKKVCVCMCV